MYYGNNTCSSQQNVAGTWDSNYKFVYHMNGTGTKVYDSTSNNDDGTKENGASDPSETTGFIGKGQYFDGTSDWITTTNAFNSAAQDWTLELWLDYDAGEAWVQQEDNGGTGRTIMELLTGSWGTYLGGSPGYDTEVTPTGGWEHITLTVDVTAGSNNDEYKFYFNGSLGSTFSNARDVGAVNQYFYLGVGKGAHSWGQITGKEDEVRLSTGIRDPSWINTCYNTMTNTTTFVTSGSEEPWIQWSGTNPDESSPWSWEFGFPDGGGYYEFYSIGKKSGSVDETAPGSADAMCHYLENTSINVTPSQWDIGTIDIGDTNETIGFYFNLANEGNVALDITINATNATNTTTPARWNLTATPGHDNFSLQYNKSGGGSWTNINITFDTFITDLAIGGHQTFDLKLLMATTSSTVDPMGVTVTFKSVAS